MLMSRQVIASNTHDRAVFGRFRFQLPVLWIVAVLVPTLVVYTGLITAETHRAVLNSMVAALLASVAGLLLLRRVDAFPGIRSYMFILPTLAASYGTALVLIFGLRLSYSRSVLGGSFTMALLTVFILVYIAERLKRLHFFVVPGGDVHALRRIRGAQWQTLNTPTEALPENAMVVADFRHDHSGEWERLLARAAISGRVVYHSKLLHESLTGKVTIEHLSENSFGSLLPNLAYRKLKRLGDLLICLLLAPLLIVPMIVIALLVRLDSTGPVFFRQPRVGYRGEVFNMVKFRSMRPRVSAATEDAVRQDAMTRDGDDRVTRIGRFIRRTRLDELPQIFNIARGEMSWIGPRPEAVPLSKWYEKEIPFYSYRHIVRPGISGWAQVQQGHVTELDAINEKLAYDFYYVKYFSAWLDMIIALRTIPTMIGGFGAR
jgi:lipopolysaccharide/colanic/teichoic acid biosynthesis glycosyltransferase